MVDSRSFGAHPYLEEVEPILPIILDFCSAFKLYCYVVDGLVL